MPLADTWYAYLHLRGDFDPDDITHWLGITPSETKRQGDPLPSGSVGRMCSLWALHSRLPRTEPLESQVSDVLDQMDRNKTALMRVSREFGGTMQLVGYFSEKEPGVHFDRVTIERIAGYSLAIDCDFYNRR